MIGHEELFIQLHDHLPPEMVFESELLIWRLTSRSANATPLPRAAALLLAPPFDIPLAATYFVIYARCIYDGG